MKVKEFFGKFGSAFLWGNLLAMLIVIVLLALGVKYGLDWYTHHGEGVRIPKVEGITPPRRLHLPSPISSITVVSVRQRQS